MPFQLVVITPESTSSSEPQLARALFERGLEVLHVRKPRASAAEVAQYLEALPPAYRRRCQLHQHHDLRRRTAIRGIHYREADRPEGIIKAPAGLAVSTSFHSLWELGVCRGEVDYSLLSPVYDSISKTGYAAAFPDRDELAGALAGSRYPVLALGGVAPRRLPELQALGFSGAALLGAVWSAPDPAAAFEEALRAAERLGAAGLGELLEGEEAEATQPSPRAAAAAAGAGASQPDALSSAKIRTLIARPHADEAEFAASGGGGGAGPLKSVVFSQFTQFLDLVQPALEAEGCLRLDGRTPAARRGEVLRSFSSCGPGSPTINLISLKAGGSGLNLISASRVHMLDPGWNPAVEEQAMDRVHRLGQQREVRVYRYVVGGSIEERMLELQEAKLELMKAAFERRTAQDMRQMRLRDVRLLMDL